MNLSLKEHFEKIVNFTDAEFEYIASHFAKMELKKNELLLRPGQQKVGIYFVVSGILKSYFLDKKEKEHILQFAQHDWWITDYKAFFNQAESTIYIDSLTDCELLYISNENLEKLAVEFHKMEYFLRVKSNACFIAIQDRLLTMLYLNASERFDYFINLHPSLLNAVPKYLIASYIGISREMLSRLTSKVTI